MIYLRNLDIEGGLCYNKVSLPLANQGMTLLVGNNSDELAGSSNGAGKTSTFEILTHILFSYPPKIPIIDSNPGLRDTLFSGFSARSYPNSKR